MVNIKPTPRTLAARYMKMAASSVLSIPSVIGASTPSEDQSWRSLLRDVKIM